MALVHTDVFFLLAAMGLVAGVSFRGGASESAVLIVARACEISSCAVEQNTRQNHLEHTCSQINNKTIACRTCQSCMPYAAYCVKSYQWQYYAVATMCLDISRHTDHYCTAVQVYVPLLGTAQQKLSTVSNISHCPTHQPHPPACPPRSPSRPVGPAQTPVELQAPPGSAERQSKREQS